MLYAMLGVFSILLPIAYTVVVFFGIAEPNAKPENILLLGTFLWFAGVLAGATLLATADDLWRIKHGVNKNARAKDGSEDAE
ncbi:MAG: hypothetical protein A3B29_01425 [Candidatus Sungbacteria bacterium RIFCSPLOWO2_01_FULL_51_34]|nr:MAG: hypothetical protein A3B29_01425 [Candidatus Sungbacteria bacterium RIFCSPLOWO2_01_FULL_51_34]